VSKNFGHIVVVDFEYEVAAGELPNVLCMVAYVLDENLQHVGTIKLWRGEFGSAPPFDIGPDTLFVAYSCWAEMTCFMQLGWKFPKHVYDLHTAYLAASNVLLPYEPEEERTKPGKGLSNACRDYGISGWEVLDKKNMAKDIGEGRWWIYGRETVLAYCEEDVRASTELLRRQLRGGNDRRPWGFHPVNTAQIIHWSDYSAKTVAQIQARGMLIDVPLWDAVQENKLAAIDALRRKFDPSYGSDDPIYTPEGEWAYHRFEQFLIRIGAPGWPRLQSGALDISGDAFRLMYHVSGIEGLHALRDSLGVIVRAKLPIGRDGRNRPSIFPFGTATGRNAHSKSLFNSHAGVRPFMIFPPEAIGIYADWRTQEVAVGAAYSGDQGLIDDYLGGDVYHALALLCGLTTDRNAARWKSTEAGAAMRARMKPIQLAINYGMGVRSLAKGLDRHPLIASAIIERHRRRYPRFWEWREDNAQRAMLDRKITSEFTGWPLYLSSSPNKRTLYNFPCQSGGAEMLRLAATRLCDAGIVPNMLVHDAVLLEARDDDQVRQTIEIMEKAGADVCRGLKVDADLSFDSRKYGAHFYDKRPVAQKMWKTLMDVMRDIGAVSGEAS
jgi:DNA polymerase I